MNIQVQVLGALPDGQRELAVLAGKVGKKAAVSSLLPGALKAKVLSILKEEPELTEFGRECFFYVDGRPAIKLLLAGAGAIEEFTQEKSRTLGGNIARACAAGKQRSPAVCFPDALAGDGGRIGAFAEGAILGGYVFDRYKTEKNSETLNKVLLAVSGAAGIETAVKEAECIGASVNLARDLINSPANVIYPESLAREAEKMAAEAGVALKILEEQDMEKLGMGALLSVSKGSAQPPKLLVLEYVGKGKGGEKIAFVGKGVTFDSGGISIKPAAGMGDMKNDMGGAAVVLAAVCAIARLKLPINIVGVIPCVENMPSGTASRPGDIVTSASGKTIEIISTDCEGRMILADAVWYAGAKLSAAKIIDIATLTGAASIALGDFVAGVVASNQELCDRVVAAGRISGERCWQMPSFDEFKEYNKSDVADIKNSGGRNGGMITGGMFIGEFTDKPWVHIDIGNTDMAKKTVGYAVKGASGFGVRLLIQTARQVLAC
ncbi:MAG: leucyl aminopeptidase [Acidaminococcales bacterium]|nr:leucyl aminopeptidase [Acidaminococcales bacterium]